MAIVWFILIYSISASAQPCNLGDFELTCGTLPGQPSCIICDDDSNPGDEVISINVDPALDLCYVIQNFDDVLGLRTDTFCDPGTIQYFVSMSGWMVLTQVYDPDTGCQDFDGLGDTVFVDVFVEPIVTPEPDTQACNFFILTEIEGVSLTGTEAYYTQSGGTGTMYEAGDTIFNSITLYAFDGIATCFDEEPFTITIGPNIFPTLDYPDFCENETGAPASFNPPGGTFSFNPDPGDGAFIDPVTGEITNSTGGSTYEVAYTSPSPCQNTVTRSVDVFDPPVYAIMGSACDTGTTWQLDFSTDADVVTASDGVILDLGGGNFELNGIPWPNSVTVEFTSTTTGCTNQITLGAPPGCGCSTIDPPISSVDTAYYCETDPPPVLSVTVGAGLVTDWYDAPSGGNLLAQATNTYQPPTIGVYYAEARDPVTGCVSDRIAIVVEFIPLTSFSIFYDTCGANGFTSFTITFPIGNEPDSMVATPGTPTRNPDGSFFIEDIPNGSSVDLVWIYLPSGCSQSFTVSGIVCNCPGLPPPVSAGDVSVCDDGSPFPLLEVITQPGLEANWYDAPTGGNLLAQGTNIYQPTAPGTYYVASYDPILDCEGNSRTAVTLTLLDLPEFEILADSCDQGLFVIVFETNAGTVTVTPGLLEVYFGGLFSAYDLDPGANFTLSLVGPNQCTFDTTFVIPNCDCPTIPPPVSGGNVSFCPGEPIPIISASVPAGFTIDWYDAQNGGSLLLSSSTTFQPPSPGVYFAEARDPNTGCTSDIRTAIIVEALDAPSLILDSVVCVGSDFYSIYFQTTATTVTTSQGLISSPGSGMYLIENCPANTSTTISLTSADGCTLDTIIQSPNCDCPGLPPPVSGGDVSYCTGEPVPTISATPGSGQTVDWYDSPTGGILLLSDSEIYQPPGPGIYYAEARDPVLNCTSDLRTAIIVQELDLPDFSLDSVVCDGLDFYTIYFQSNALNVSTDQGNVSSPGGGIYQIENCAVGISTEITLVSGDNCILDTIIQSPNCSCPTIPPPVSGGDVSYCAGEPVPTISATTGSGQTVDWYDSLTDGNLLLSDSETYQPTGPGVYYAEARDPVLNCTSDLRTAITVQELDLPDFLLDSVVCDGVDFYTIYFQSNALNISADQGNVSNQGGGIYQIENCAAGISTQITLVSGDNCIQDTIIQSPNCNCPIVEAPISAGDTAICPGSPIPMISVSTSGTLEVNWYDAPVNGNLLITNSENFTPPTSGTYYAEAVDPGTGCTSDTRTAVTISVLDSLRFQFDSLICDLTDTTFNLILQTNALDINSSQGMIIDLGNGVYSITSLTSSESVTITFNSADACSVDTTFIGPDCNCPTILPPIVSSDTSYCFNTEIPIITAQSPLDYPVVWYDSLIGGNTLDSNTLTFSPTMAGTYFASVINPDNFCESVRVPVSISVFDASELLIDTVVCNPNRTYNIEFSFAATDIGLSNGTLDTIGLNRYRAQNVAEGQDLILQLADTNGCTLDTIVSAPNCDCPEIQPPTSNGDFSICSDNEIPVLSVVSQSSLLVNWYASSTGDDLLVMFSDSLLPSSPGIYYAESVDSTTGCTSARIPIELTVLPEPEFIVDSLVCLDNPAYYQLYITSNDSIATNINLSITNNGSSWIVDSISSTDSLGVRIISADGCVLDSFIRAPQCNCPIINPPTSDGNIQICEGDTIPELAVMVPPGFSANWYDASQGGTLLSENSLTYNPIGAGSFFVETVDTSSGCRSDDRIVINLSILERPLIQLIDEAITCSGNGEIILETNASDIDFFTFGSDIDLELNEDTINYLLPDTGIYLLEVIARNETCIQKDTIQLTFEEFKLELNINQPGCLDSTGTITIEGNEIYQPFLFYENSELLDDFTEFPIEIQRGAGTYIYNIQSLTGCNETFEVEIEDRLIPFVDLGPDLQISDEQPVQLQIQTNLNPVQYIWNNSTGVTSPNSLNPIIFPDSDFLYILTIEDPEGCTATDSLFISLLTQNNLFIPSAFSPNNDGINDTFKPLTNKNPMVNQFQIYDRWGNKVFERSDIEDIGEMGWNGEYQGRELNPGVFVYYLEVEWSDGNTESFAGEVHLIR